MRVLGSIFQLLMMLCLAVVLYEIVYLGVTTLSFKLRPLGESWKIIGNPVSARATLEAWQVLPKITASRLFAFPTAGIGLVLAFAFYLVSFFCLRIAKRQKRLFDKH